jgi:hypothetical protein
MKKIITILVIATLFGCKNTEEYPITHYTREGSMTYLNDSIVVICTSIKGIGNYETKIVNLKKQ